MSPRNAGRKGRKLGPYRTGRVNWGHISILSPAELQADADEARPATALERAIMPALLDVSVFALTEDTNAE